jgi:phosphoribosylformimino-5-aminoimidazole carboxamide ribotide isomerase
MILYPAIDILDGQAVRLVKGDFAEQTVYDDDPVRAARRWVDDGARFLHVVDLDGARAGRPVNLDHLGRIASALDVPVQYGGGLRTLPAVRDALRAGAQRAILGTAALTDVDLLDEVLAAYGDRVLVSVDVRGGHVATAGWTETTQMGVTDVIERLQARGVRRFVYTSVDRDGMLQGPDLDEVRRVAASVRGRFLYSGGIGSLDDLRGLGGLRQVNLSGVIVGKALYERRFSVAEGQMALEQDSHRGELR